MNSTLALASILLLTGQPGDAAPTGSSVTLDHCVISLIDHVNVPAEEAGVITEILAKENNVVKKGQILAQIDDTDAKMRLVAAQAELAVSKMQADNQVNVDAAKAAKDVARAEVEDAEAINLRSPGSVTNTELRKLRFSDVRYGMQIMVAEHEVEIAVEQSKVKAVQVDAVNSEIKRRKIDAAHDGIIVQVFKRPGDWVQPGDPIVRLVRMDRLRVEGFVNADDFLPSEISGKPVTIRMPLPHNQVAVAKGVIDYYSPIVEASGEYRVWAEIENRMENGYWVFRPGLTARMDIQVGNAPSSNAGRANANNASAQLQPQN